MGLAGGGEAAVGGYCEGPECMNRAHSKGLCERCLKRRQRGRALVPPRPRLTAREAMFEAMIAIVEADPESDGEYGAAWERFLYHGARYFREQCAARGGQGRCQVEGRG